MNNLTSPLADGALSLADLRALGVKPQDINAKWMNEMVNRLFTELKRELSQLENAKPVAEGDLKQATARATNARTLDSLQRTLTNLAEMKAKRDAIRASKAMKKPGGARAEVRREVLGVVDGIRAQRGTGESQ